MGHGLAERIRFVRERTALAPVPLVPEIALHQATEVTPLWHATAAELRGWDEAPFWAFPWAGGQALARFALDRPELVRGRVVVDFGTGSGLVAIAAAMAGAARALAFDVDPFCEAAVRLNAEANGVEVEFHARSPLGEPLPGAEVVLAGDVFYERDLASRFLAWGRGLAAAGTCVLAGDPGRNHSPAGLAELARYEVATPPEIEERPSRTARVLAVGAPPALTPGGAGPGRPTGAPPRAGRRPG
jgi:predicted nicotinamide N-methyase